MSLVRRGLSLIELLIVVALIATMMALSLPMLTSANAKARSELCRQNMGEIGQTVVSFTQDMNYLPTLHSLEPTQPGLSLPEFAEPRLQSPYALICPSDETDASVILGTSYQWSSTFNGLKVGELEPMLGRPLLADREAFHSEPCLPINEMVLAEDDAGYRLTLLGEDPRSERAYRESLYLQVKPDKKQGHHKDKDKSHPGQGQGNAYGRHRDRD